MNNDIIAHFGLSGGLDILSVASELKRGSRIRTKRFDLPLIPDLIRGLGLYMAVGSFQIIPSNTKGFSEWCQYSKTEPGQNHYHYVYIARSLKDAEMIRHLDESGNAEKTGEFYGYPGCCISNFTKVVRTGATSNLLLKSYEGYLIIPWIMNVVGAYFDRSLLSYYPCSPFCRQSIEFSNRRLSIIKNISSEAAKNLSDELTSCLFIGDGNLGGVMFKGIWDENGLVVKSVIRKDDNSFISNLIVENETIEVCGSHYKLNSISIKSEKARLFIHN